MSEEFYFEKLDVYQKALDFINEVYGETKKWPREYSFSLIDQIRRASLSIALNIAEGACRTKPEFRRFITISRGSCHECIPIIEISHKQGIISTVRKEVWKNKVISLSKMLSSLKNSIKDSHN